MTTGLQALEARVAKDLSLVAYPDRDWVPPRHGPDGARLLDVLIVGAGQGGLAVAFRLLRERVSNILLIDRRPPGGGVGRLCADGDATVLEDRDRA